MYLLYCTVLYLYCAVLYYNVLYCVQVLDEIGRKLNFSYRA